MNPRTQPAIALGPSGNASGGYRFFLLDTKQVVVRNRFQQIPITPDIIQQMNQLADQSSVCVIEDDEPTTPIITTEIAMNRSVSEYGSAPLTASTTLPTASTNSSDISSETTIPIESKAIENEAIENEQITNTEHVVNNTTTNIIDLVEPTHKYNLRPRSKIDYSSKRIHHVSMKQAKKLFGQLAQATMSEELQGILSKGVWVPIHNSNVKPIYSHMIFKAKYNPDGSFNKVKCRLTANGNRQNRFDFSINEISSPTVSITSVFTIATIAAANQYLCASADIGTAYLNASMPDDVEIVMILQKEIVDILIQLDKSYIPYVRKDGTLLVRLKKALYGCINSAKLWYDHIRDLLINEGFTVNSYDQCVFKKDETIITLYVDDILVFALKQYQLDNLFTKLKEWFINVTINSNMNAIPYLGMIFSFHEKSVIIDMPKYIDTILEDYDGDAYVSPATDKILHNDKNGVTDNIEQSQQVIFHSTVARLLYLGKRTRPDILFAVSLLSSRVNNPSVQDMNSLNRLLGYLKLTSNLNLVLKATLPITINWYADASFGIHKDGKSHSGNNLSLGIGSVSSKSNKQRIVTKSSTEAEIVAVSDGLSDALWLLYFILDLNITNIIKIRLHQDNTSAIKLENNGTAIHHRCKHLNIRHLSIIDYINNGDISIQHVDTSKMIADILTKPLNGSGFIRLRDLLLGKFR